MAGQGTARHVKAWRGTARIIKITMKTILVQVEGVTPLLMNRFREKAIDSKSKRRPGSLTEQDIEDKLYLVDRKPCIPGIYFRNSIVEAAKQFKITGKGKATYSKLAGSTLSVQEEYLPIQPGEYEIYRVATVNPMTKGRMMVSRPRFNKWAVKFHVELLDDGLSKETLNEIIQHAGMYVGVGDWRPDKKGTFGKYMITEFKEQ